MIPRWSIRLQAGYLPRTSQIGVYSGMFLAYQSFIYQSGLFVAPALYKLRVVAIYWISFETVFVL